MALYMTEKQAVKVLFAQLQKKKTSTGLNNFAREVLDANHDQAARLVALAKRLEMGASWESIEPDLADPEEVKASVSVSGSQKELNFNLKSDALPITTLDELLEYFEVDTDVWIPENPIFNFWGSQTNPNFQVKAKFRRNEYKFDIESDRARIREDMQKYAPVYESSSWVNPPKTGRLLEVFITDAHFDRLTRSGYTLEEARERILTTVRSSVIKSRSDGIEEILLVLNGDIFNSDFDSKTTKGTQQSNNSFPDVSFTFVRQTTTDIIDILARVAPVTVEILGGNHDRYKAYQLADSVSSFYYNTGRVKVTLDPETRRYFSWGKVLLGFAHGEENKKELPFWMLKENNIQDKEVFEWHLGHIHTAKVLPQEEVSGMLMRYFRSQAPHSEWEDSKFVSNVHENVAMVWDKDVGKVAEYPVQFLSNE